MGFLNWTLNRANTTSGRGSITVRATDPSFLDAEIQKAERKGYVRTGNPYTALEYGKTVFYQSMTIGEGTTAGSVVNKQSKEQAKIDLEIKKLELAQKKQEIENAKTPEQKAKEKEKNIAKAKLAGSLALGPLGLISKKNRENIKNSVNKLLDK